MNVLIEIERIKTALTEGDMRLARRIKHELYRGALLEYSEENIGDGHECAHWLAEAVLEAENLGVPDEP